VTRRGLAPILVLLALLGVVLASSGGASAQDPDYQLPTLQYLNPFPVVRLAGHTTKTGADVSLLQVTAPRGSNVTVRCRGGKRRGCPFKSRSTTAPKSRQVRFRKLQHRYKAGAKLSLFVRRGNTIGKYTVFTVRKGKNPSRKDACLLPGDPFEPAGCP
jgi:hypothetical protein